MITIIPAIYDNLKECVGVVIDAAEYISFTTDIWSIVIYDPIP